MPELIETGDVDAARIGYPAVREAFNETLGLCVDKLTRAELTLAQDVLGIAGLDGDTPGLEDMLADAALYSTKGPSGIRAGRRRAIDRIAPKLRFKNDPLKSFIAARLPAAVYSLWEIGEAQVAGGVLARDLLNDSREIHIMDHGLAAHAAGQGEKLIAGRFLNLGPWHIGFGIVRTIRKSEAVAVRLACSQNGPDRGLRGNLHELIYPAQLHEENIVMTALEQVIMPVAFAIDAGMIDVDALLADFGGLFDDKTGDMR